MPTHLITAAIIRRQGDILLVKQQGPDDPAAFWALPGGVVESGEMLLGALAREVWEETGLILKEVGTLAYVAQLHNMALQIANSGELPPPGSDSLAFIFEAVAVDGEMTFNDPDELVSEAQFVPMSEVIVRLSQIPFRIMREPLVSYLRGEVGAGAVWQYRREANGADTLVTRSAGAAVP